MSIGPSMPLRLEKPEGIDLAQAARYFGARGGADAATQALLEKCAVPPRPGQSGWRPTPTA